MSPPPTPPPPTSPPSQLQPPFRLQMTKQVRHHSHCHQFRRHRRHRHIPVVETMDPMRLHPIRTYRQPKVTLV